MHNFQAFLRGMIPQGQDVYFCSFTMYRTILTSGCFVILCALTGVSFAVAQGTPADTIILANPSFEDQPRAGGSGFILPIRGWYDCGLTLFPDQTPPDIHPHPMAWRVTKSPQHGNTYLGMVVRDDETWESLSQAFSAPLKGGECYAMSVWLCRSESYFSHRTSRGDSLYPFTRPAVLRIFGGSGLCKEGELLAESEPVVSHDWVRYTFKLEPVSDQRFITIQAFYKTPVLTPYNGHVLVDNISPIIRIPCKENNIARYLDPIESPSTPSAKPPATPERPATPATRPTTPPPPPPKIVEVEEPVLLQELRRDNLHRGKTIRIENLHFKADSSKIDASSYPVLDEIARFMKKNPNVVIEIGGHTNTKPSTDYCNDLSTARARSVMEYLIGQGVSKHQLEYKGYGKTKPLVPNDWYDRMAQTKNQRVELKILSL